MKKKPEYLYDAAKQLVDLMDSKKYTIRQVEDAVRNIQSICVKEWRRDMGLDDGSLKKIRKSLAELSSLELFCEE